MASEKLFSDIPPFPDNVPTAPMRKISLANLRLKDDDAAKSAFAACQELGFFLLDLHGDGLGEAIMDEIDQLFNAADGIMNLPEDVKEQYLFDFPKSFLG
jgi:isopenicillin N synthase-like dioxygenase